MKIKFYLLLAVLVLPNWGFSQCTLANYTTAGLIGPSAFPYFSPSSGVTVSATIFNVPTLTNFTYTCGGNSFTCSSPAWWPQYASGWIQLNFSQPVSSFSVVVNGTNLGEVFTFTTVTGSITLQNYCTAGFFLASSNQLQSSSSAANGTLITVSNPAGSTQYTLTHNGTGSGSRLTLLDCFVTTVVLPAEVKHFDAEYNAPSDLVALNWETSLENNCKSFEIEHSMNGLNWETISEEAGHGTTQSTHQYSSSHFHPVSGTHYYRLRQVDFSGNSNLSEVKEVLVDNNHPLSVFPNPGSGKFSVTASGHIGFLTVTDLAGKIIFESELNESLEVDLSRYNAGIYLFHFRDQQNFQTTERVVLH